MGHYTAMAVRCRLNPTGVAVFQDKLRGKTWQEIASLHPVVAGYATLERAESIPHGVSAYFGRGDFAEVGFDVPQNKYGCGHLLRLEGDELEVACSLKNYRAEIAAFTRLLAPLIQDRCVVYSRYEAADEWDDVRVRPTSS